jgi:hypothetical protein
MNFQCEESESRLWSAMQAEHDLLEDTLKLNPVLGRFQHLDHRVVDTDRKVALYYVAGIGKGDGCTFALVQGSDIVWIDVMTVRPTPEKTHRVLDVTRVSIAENLYARRDAYSALICDAVTAYVQQFPFHFTNAPELPVNVEKTAWHVGPERAS